MNELSNKIKYHGKIFGSTPWKISSMWFAKNKYPIFSLDEKLTLMLGNMMYGQKLSDLSFDEDDIYGTLLKCNRKSWNQSCRMIQSFYNVEIHDVDKELSLLKSFRTILNDHLENCKSYPFVSEYRDEAGQVLRLYHLLRYDKSKIYDLISEFQSCIDLPVFDYISNQLKKSNIWSVEYVHDAFYWSNKIAFHENCELPLLNKRRYEI